MASNLVMVLVISTLAFVNQGFPVPSTDLGNMDTGLQMDNDIDGVDSVVMEREVNEEQFVGFVDRDEGFPDPSMDLGNMDTGLQMDNDIDGVDSVIMEREVNEEQFVGLVDRDEETCPFLVPVAVYDGDYCCEDENLQGCVPCLNTPCSSHTNAVRCTVPTVTGGTTVPSAGDDAVYGTSYTLTCNYFGYHLTENLLAADAVSGVCQEDGSFAEPHPSCYRGFSTDLRNMYSGFMDWAHHEDDEHLGDDDYVPPGGVTKYNHADSFLPDDHGMGGIHGWHGEVHER